MTLKGRTVRRVQLVQRCFEEVCTSSARSLSWLLVDCISVSTNDKYSFEAITLRIASTQVKRTYAVAFCQDRALLIINRVRNVSLEESKIVSERKSFLVLETNFQYNIVCSRDAA